MNQTETIQFPIPRLSPLDPPPQYKELAEEHGVFQVQTPGGNAWVVTRYDHVRAVLSDRRFSSDPRSAGYPSYLTGDLEPPPGFFMQVDAPEHTRLRKYVTREFVGARVEALRPSMERILDELIDKMQAKGNEAELIEDLALPMASRVICELLGVSTDDTQFVKDNVDLLLDRSSTPEQCERASIVLAEYFDALVGSKLERSSEDLLGRLVEAAQKDQGLTRPELAGIATLLLLGGYDTMVQMIGLGALTFLKNPDQLKLLKEQPELAGQAVDETLRYLTVNHAGLPRAALEDVEVGGRMISKGDGVLVMINAANRDDSAFDSPSEFRIQRNAGRHVAFGHGLHKCIGLTLARVELETVYLGLFRRLPELQLTTPEQDLKFRHEMVLYGVNSLSVSF